MRCNQTLRNQVHTHPHSWYKLLSYTPTVLTHSRVLCDVRDRRTLSRSEQDALYCPCLTPRYAMPGPDLDHVALATRCRATAMRCPVLSEALVLPGGRCARVNAQDARARLLSSGTQLRYHPRVERGIQSEGAREGLSPMLCPVLTYAMLLCPLCYAAMPLPSYASAMSGTHICSSFMLTTPVCYRPFSGAHVCCAVSHQLATLSMYADTLRA
eukprot:3934491-Rhodomonas_salina.1